MRECEPDGLLAQVIYINLVGLSEKNATMALLGGLEDRGKPQNVPDFPGGVSFPGPAITAEYFSQNAFRLRQSVVLEGLKDANKSLRL